MRIYMLGTCAGTEPMPNRRHASFAVETGGSIYWFDAGEGCSRTAHLMGVDLLSIREIFISHTHMDHVGGLGNLLWNMRKLSSVQKRLPQREEITVHIPNLQTWQGVLQILQNTEGDFQWDCKFFAKKTKDGLLHQDENIAVFAYHNHHLPLRNGTYPSFSFSIQAEGKTLVYSGDIGEMDDLKEAVAGGCDLLLVETGHHRVKTVCAWAKENKVKNLLFLHNGREILENPLQAAWQAQTLFGGPAVIGEDGTFFDF